MAGAPRPVHAAAEHVPAGESGGPAGRRLRVSFLVPLPPSSSSCDAVQEEAMESIGGGSIGLCSGTGLGGGGGFASCSYPWLLEERNGFPSRQVLKRVSCS